MFGAKIRKIYKKILLKIFIFYNFKNSLYIAWAILRNVISFNVVKSQYKCKIGIKYLNASEAVCAYAHVFRKRPGCALIRACALIRMNTVTFYQIKMHAVFTVTFKMYESFLGLSKLQCLLTNDLSLRMRKPAICICKNKVQPGLCRT